MTEMLLRAVVPGADPATDRSPVDVLVRDGVVAGIAAAGSLSTTGEVLDGRGTAVLLPGLRDGHVHLSQWAISRQRIDLTGAPSASDAVAVMAAAARDGSGHGRIGGVLTGFGYRDSLWPDRPHAALLQRALPDDPVALVSQDLHAVWLSPAALALVGRSDHPTGVLTEDECFAAMGVLPTPSDDELDRWAVGALAEAARRGVTAVVDFEFTDTLAVWRRRARSGPLPTRVVAAIHRPRLDEVLAAGVRTGDVVDGTDGLVAVGPCKVLLDGSLNTRTALCHQPYPDGGFGVLTQDVDELSATIAAAARHGVHFAVHAIGDRANSLALDCFQRAGVGGRIEHAQLLDEADVPRFAQLGVTASVQPAHAVDDRDVTDVIWADRAGRAYPWRSLFDAGATLEFGSDAPVALLDPWHAIGAAVHRSDDDRPAWHPEQAATVVEAIAASTGGLLAVPVGHVADLVLVGADPLQLPTGELAGVPVLATLLAGRTTHRDASLG